MAVGDWQQTDGLDEVERVVVEFADVLSRTPVVMPADLGDRLRVVLSEKQITELANEVAWENARARFNRGLGVEADGYREHTG